MRKRGPPKLGRKERELACVNSHLGQLDMNLQHGFDMTSTLLNDDSEHPLCESLDVEENESDLSTRSRLRFFFCNFVLSAIAIPAITKWLKLCFVLVFYQPYPYWHCNTMLSSCKAPLVGPISTDVSRFL